MDNIKISVIIPVYNTAIYLSRCLDSLCEQKYRNVEYILVDDGSTDNSLDICKHYAALDGRFVVISKENGGPSSARNLAISKSRGEYIGFVDSDDYVRGDAYEIIAAQLEKNNNPDCLIFGANLVPDYAPDYLYGLVNTRNASYTQFSPDVLFEEVGSRPFLWLQIMKRSIIVENNIRMDESIRLGEDQLFQMEFMPKAKTFVFISDKLYFYRWKRPGSIMHDTSEKKAEKMLLHVDLVDKVMTLMERSGQDDEMKKRTLIWATFFLFHDLMNSLEEVQGKVAFNLVNVLEKHNYRDIYPSLNIWAQVRLDHIVLMAEPDKDKRIEGFKLANEKLKEKLEELKGTPEYAQYLKKTRKRKGYISKFFQSLKRNGFRETFRRVFRKLRGR